MVNSARKKLSHKGNVRAARPSPNNAKGMLLRAALSPRLVSSATWSSRDSGSANNRSGIATRGATPPKKNIVDQSDDFPRAATKLTSAPPLGSPAYKAPIDVFFRVGEEFSETSATRLGRAPPIPSPVRKRATSSISKLGARPVATDMSPKTATDAISTRFLPNLSESLPPIAAPSINPKVEEEKNHPS